MTVSHLPAQFSLEDRYDQDTGVVLLTGIAALVRALQTRAQLDRLRGATTGCFVSGYRGSPLGGLDKALWAEKARLEALDITFQPGVNEDLAATAVWGSQQVGLHPVGATPARVEGAFGLWYGKAPGLDRSCDAIRHANAWGTSAEGGVVMVVGDDPAAKSSSLASQSEFTLQDLMVPILAPSNVQDVLDFTVLGWELSRHSGLWVALKAIADHMDSSATVEVDIERFSPTDLEPVTDVHIRREDTPVAQEQRLLGVKLPAAVQFARAAGINRRVTAEAATKVRPAKLGIMAVGKAYADVREAFSLLGLMSTDDIRLAGVELVKVGMPWPLDHALARDLAEDVEALLVVEEKRAFVEPQVKDALYGHSQVPVLGKFGLNGQPLVSGTGILSVAEIGELLLDLLDGSASTPSEPAMLGDARIDRPRALAFIADARHAHIQSEKANAPARAERTPLFCAGCPHNTSTRVPDGSRATAGIGCHYMVQWMGDETDSCTQMGGEGVTWLGEAPFTEERHIFANLGDGTYFHSGVLAIRQAVAARVNITYKILFNDAVAMTGGQPTDGEQSVASVVAQVRAEGVARVVIVSDDPSRHDELRRSASVEVLHRERLDEVQRELRETKGTTVLIYEQTCATELRRRRKRGLVADEKPRLMINEAVCDGCGDCTTQSRCVAVEPVPTAMGTKRKINQTSCNKDLSCASGYCPAFVEVEGALRRPQAASFDLAELKAELVEPAIQASSNETADILITGVGGTGIVTLSALLATAAKIDQRHVLTLDMTGLAQKGGAVFSHVRIARQAQSDLGLNARSSATLVHAPRIAEGQASVVIGCDLVSTASSEALELMSQHTQVFLNSEVAPTAEFVLHQEHDVRFSQRLQRLKRLTQSVHSLAAQARSQTVLGDTAQANVMLLGFAFQAGGVPVSLASLEQAIELNGVSVERNLLALNVGRALYAASESKPSARVLGALEGVLGQQQPTANHIPNHTPNLGDLDFRSLREHRIAALQAYQGRWGGIALSRRFSDLIDRVAIAEQKVKPGSERLSRAVARSYAKLLMIKDEYEVARLHTALEFTSAMAAQFESNYRFKYLLAPPALGPRKRKFGRWLTQPLRALATLRGIRNRWFDPFAYSEERRCGIELIEHFERVVAELVQGLNIQNLAIAVEVAKLPEQMRGFGHVKAAQVAQALEAEDRLMQEFNSPPDLVNVFDPQRVGPERNEHVAA